MEYFTTDQLPLMLKCMKNWIGLTVEYAASVDFVADFCLDLDSIFGVQGIFALFQWRDYVNFDMPARTKRKNVMINIDTLLDYANNI